MTIEKDGAGFSIECNVCGDIEFLDAPQFLLAVNLAKDMDWKARKNKETGEWEHVCPSCVEEGKG
jgi:hypothetical protein